MPRFVLSWCPKASCHELSEALPGATAMPKISSFCNYAKCIRADEISFRKPALKNLPSHEEGYSPLLGTPFCELE